MLVHFIYAHVQYGNRIDQKHAYLPIAINSLVLWDM